MTTLYVIAEAGRTGRAEEIARTFGVDWPHLGAQCISFTIVCVLLYRFAYRPVLQMLEQRRQRIAEGLAKADKQKKVLEEAEGQRQEILQKANEKAVALIEEARTAAARILDEETKKAHVAAAEVREKSLADDARAHDQMLADLRREVGMLVVKTTAAVTGKVLTPDDQKRLMEESAKQVAA